MNRERKIITGLVDAIAHAKGERTAGRETDFTPIRVDVRDIRQGLGLSQNAFALRYGFPVGTVRNWEQGRRMPEGAARILLQLIKRHPEIVEESLLEAV